MGCGAYSQTGSGKAVDPWPAMKLIGQAVAVKRKWGGRGQIRNAIFQL